MSSASSSSDRRIAVIMFTDVVGYTSLMQHNESQALSILSLNRSLHKQLIDQNNGQFLKEIGDGILASFNSSSDAIQCAKEITREIQKTDFSLRIGLHQGEVIFKEGDVYGDGVNIASRIQELAVPNSIFFTRRIYEDLKNKPEFNSKFIGETGMKNVENPISVYALRGDGLEVPDRIKSTIAQNGRLNFRLIWAAAVALALLVLIIFFRDRFNTTKPRQINFNSELQVPRTMAVIPFSNLADETSTDFLGFALADEVISSLSYIKNIVIRPSSTVRKYQNQINDPQTIALDLNVNFVLMGHYLRQQDSLKLNLELIDIEQNKVQWSGSVEKNTTQIFELQKAVANEIINGLEVEFSIDERDRMDIDIPDDPLAYEYYLRAVAYPSNLDGYRLGQEMIKKSIALDSSFAPAFNVLGDRTYRLARYALPENQNEEIQKAIGYYNHALKLNPNLMDALGNVSMVLTEIDRKDAAITMARRSMELNPNNSFAQFALGFVCRYTGILDVAMDAMSKAVELDPSNPRFRSIVVTMILGRQYEKALENFHLDPLSPWTDAWKGFVQLKLNNLVTADSLLSRVVRTDPDGLLGIWSQGLLAFVRKTEYQQLTEFMTMQESLEDPESIFWNAVVHSLLDQDNLAISYLKRAIDKGYYPYPYFLHDSFLDPIRDHPEFDGILKLAEEKHLSFKSRHFSD